MKKLTHRGLLAFCTAQLACSSNAATALDHSSDVSFSGGDGTSCETAVIIRAPNVQAGVHAEYEWLARKHPGNSLVRQSLLDCNDKPADRVTILVSGEERHVYFDISGFYGD